MGSVIVDLIPLIIGAAVVPVWIIIVLLMLSAAGGLRKAAAFVAGSLLARVAQGVVFGYVFLEDMEAYGPTGPAIIKSTLLLVIGLMMLILAYLKWRKEEDPDAPPPKWMSAIGGMSTARALAGGILLTVVGVKQWVFTLAALATITEAQLGRALSGLAYLFFILAATSLMLIALISYAVAPRQAGAALNTARAWLERNSRPLTVIVSLVFGAYFLIMGISGLLG